MAKEEAQEIKVYGDSEKSPQSSQSNDRDFVRNIVLAELKHFRDYISSSWGGMGSGNTVNAAGLFGFFAKQGFGSYYQSPHTVQTTGLMVNGNDFGTVSVEAQNDLAKSHTVTISNAAPTVITWNSHGLTVGTLIRFTTTGSLPTGVYLGVDYYIISAGFGVNSFEISQIQDGQAVNTTSAGSGTHTASAYSATPSWSFDLPQWSQKMLVKSTGPGLVYNTASSNFTAGTVLTGGTSGATATITASFPDGTSGTLYLANIVGTFTDSEAITDSAGGSATVTRLTYTRINGIQRLYGVGGEEAGNPGVVFSFWGAIDNFCPQRFFTMPASVAGTARDVELITAFAQEGFTYVRLGTPNALRIYINGSWQTII